MLWTRRALSLGRPAYTSITPPKPPILLPPDVPVEEEMKQDYNPDHYYPVQLGEVFRSTYQVAAELGYGANSTVWLARDIRRWKGILTWKNPRYVALKICNNDHTDRMSAEHELRLSQHIAMANPSHPGLHYVRTILDAFETSGPKAAFCQWYKLDALKVTLQCFLFGLDYLHTECHVIHTDLKPENILVGLEDESVLDDVIKAEAQEPSPRKIYKGRTIYISRNNFGHPKAAKPPKITDFDTATRGDTSHPLKHPIQPNPYRAPEVTLGAPWTYSTDIWNLGVMLWDLLEGKPLCDGFDSRCNEYSSRTHLSQLIGLLGPPPQELLDRGDLTFRWFNSDGKFKRDIPKKFTLPDSVTALEGEDKMLFLEFAGKMLQWLPEDRKTAKELLEDPWFQC